MAEQGKNNKIHYKTVILNLNIINKRIDYFITKNGVSGKSIVAIVNIVDIVRKKPQCADIRT